MEWLGCARWLGVGELGTNPSKSKDKCNWIFPKSCELKFGLLQDHALLHEIVECCADDGTVSD